MVPTRPSLRHASGADDGLNMTPLMDMMFSILFFFLLATQAKNATPNIPIDLPALENVSESRAAIPDSVVMITITRDKQVYLNTQLMPTENLSRVLAEKLKEIDQSKVPDAIIRADGKTDLQTVLPVLTACREAGFSTPVIQYEDAAVSAP